jgi:hypothetical protein
MAEGDKKPPDLLDEPMVWRGGRPGAATGSTSAMLQLVRHDAITELAGASDRVFYVPVTTGPDATELEHRVRDFAATWLRIGAPGLGDALLSDPILVLGPQGTSAVPRDAFLAAVEGRQATANAADTATTLIATTATPLGDRLVLATMTWSFRHGSDEVNLVSDFLLQREDERLRCFAYLPRTNVLDHLG